MQSDAEAQEIPLSRELNDPDGLGTGWVVQVLPFQVSANGWLVPPTGSVPSATQLVAEVQETPVR